MGIVTNLNTLVRNATTSYISAHSEDFRSVVQGPQGNAGEQGEQGPAGIGIDGEDLTIEQIGYNGNGTFTWQFSDGTSFTTPNLIGPQGLQGSKGDKGDTGISVHHTKGTSTTDSEGNFGTPGEKDTYTMYGDAAETVNLGWFTVTNGDSAYSYAVAAGYTGTEDEFYETVTDYNNRYNDVVTRSDQVFMDADQVSIDTAQVAADRVVVTEARDEVLPASEITAINTAKMESIFLGSKASDPIVDNFGDPLKVGVLYYNNVQNTLKIWNGTEWNLGAFSAAGAVISFNGREGAVSLTNSDVTVATGVDLSTVEVGATADQTGAEIKALYEAQTGKILDSVTRVGLNGTSDIGRLAWNSDEQTADLKLNSDVTLQLGQEELVLVKNSTGATIANGKVVMVVGSNGNSGKLLVALHDGTKANAVPTLGITTQDILNGASGFVTRSGKVRGINTSGSAVGETWVDGNVLYVGTSGNLTKVVPGDTGLKMSIAVVISAHATNGTLFVRTNGLDENHDKDWVNAKFAVVEW